MNTFADKKTTQVKSATPAAKAPTQASMSGFSTARSMGASTGGQGAPLQIRPMSPGTVPAQGKSFAEKRLNKATNELRTALQKNASYSKRYQTAEEQSTARRRDRAELQKREIYYKQTSNRREK